MGFRLASLPRPGVVAFLGRLLVVVAFAEGREVVRVIGAVPVHVVHVGGSLGAPGPVFQAGALVSVAVQHVGP